MTGGPGGPRTSRSPPLNYFCSPLLSARISDKENVCCIHSVILSGVIVGQLMLPRDKREEEILFVLWLLLILLV